MSSGVRKHFTLNEFSEEGLFAFGDYRLFGSDLLHKFIDFSPELFQEQLLWWQVEQVDGFGLDLAVASHVLEQDAGRVVTDQELFQLH